MKRPEGGLVDQTPDPVTLQFKPPDCGLLQRGGIAIAVDNANRRIVL